MTIIGVVLIFTMGSWSLSQLSLPIVTAQTQTTTTTSTPLSNVMQSNDNNLTATLGDLIIDGVDKTIVNRVLDLNGLY